MHSTFYSLRTFFVGCIFLILSFQGRSQTLISKANTFIGKSFLEIKTLNAKDGNKPFVNESNLAENEEGIKVLGFVNERDSIYYTFDFKEGICISTVVSTQNEISNKKILSSIIRTGSIQEGDKWVQEINGVRHFWRQLPVPKTVPEGGPKIFIYVNARVN